MVRRKRIKKSLNDKGFSLIEVLVSVVILAILTLPILSSFASAAKVNATARKQESANAAAQKIMEEFKSLSLTQLTDGKAPSEEINNPATGVIRYETEDAQQTDNPKKQKIYRFTMKDTDGFHAKVTLDPTEYANKKDNQKSDVTSNNINSYEMPEFSDIQSDKNFVLMQEIYQHDYGILSEFKTIYDSNLQYSDIRREADVSVKIEEKDQGFEQSLSLKVSYVNKRNEGQKIDYEYSFGPFEIKNGEEKEFKQVYLFYNAFAPEQNILGDAGDRIHIDYQYPVDKIEKENLKVYLVEQKEKNQASQLVPLKKENISVKVQGNEISLATAGTLHLDGYTNTEGAVNIYSNIEGWDQLKSSLETGKNGLTASAKTEHSEQTGHLYRIQVELWEGEEDGTPFLTMTSTKED